MPDKRELILARLLVTAGTVPGIVKAWRDRGALRPLDPETKAANVPAIVLLDGGERTKLGGKMTNGKMVPSIITMEPEFWILLMPRPDQTNEGVGEELSLFRLRLIDKIARDSTLVALLGANGGMEYRGCQTDMMSGSSIEGQVQVNFAFDYVLNPNDLL